MSALAADLDRPERRTALADGLASLTGELRGLRGAGEALRVLRSDGDLAWQALAMALLAEALARRDRTPPAPGRVAPRRW